ncbi:MAG: hypothetical protein ABI591_22620 [Kofleriaceae bacterium]
MVELVLVAGGLIAGVAGAYLGFGWLLTRSRRVCPACLAKKLATTGGALVDGEIGGGLESHYTCEACDAEFRELGNDGLVPLEAWDRGARVPPPVAIIRE